MAKEQITTNDNGGKGIVCNGKQVSLDELEDIFIDLGLHLTFLKNMVELNKHECCIEGQGFLMTLSSSLETINKLVLELLPIKIGEDKE